MMMKRMSVLLILAALSAVGWANVLVDPGFEARPLGKILDGGDVGTWASWPGDSAVCNFNVVDTAAYTGSQSVMVGGNDTDYTNLRQSYKPAAGMEAIENKSWGYGFWVYYDSTEAGNDPATDVFYVQMAATSNWNVVHFDTWVEVLGSQLADGEWNYICSTLNVGEADLSQWQPGTPDYDNRVMNRLAIVFHRWATASPPQTGTFYIDDVEVVEGGLHLLNPNPGEGAFVTAVDPLALSWTLPEPNDPALPIYVDVVLATDANTLGWVEGVNSWTLLTDAPNATAVDATPIYYDTEYIWQISMDNTKGFLADVNGITTETFTFTTLPQNLAPDVDAGQDTTAVISGGNAAQLQLAGSVIDEGPTSNLWTVTGKAPAGIADPVFSSTTVLDPIVTFMETGTYTLTLTADDGEKIGTDSIVVTVAAELPSVLADSGFETTPLGVIPDGGAVNRWASWNGDFKVINERVRNGSQAVKVGARDLVNASGDKYSNLRSEYQAINAFEEVDDSTWVVSAWVYYDAATGAGTDAFDLRVIARDIWNTATVSSRLTVLGSDLVSGQWNFIQTSVYIPEQNLNPADPAYDNKRRKLVGIQFEQNGWTGQTGVFYVDDLSLASTNPWHWFNPSPADGDTVEPLNPLRLSWTNPAPADATDSILVDVYLSDANESTWTAADLVAEKQPVNAVDVTVAPFTTYYWRITAYDTGYAFNDPNGTTVSEVYTFTTSSGNLVPVVDAGPDVLTYLTGGLATVTMAGSVTDEGSTINAWSFVKNPPVTADPVILPADALNAEVIFYEAGTYTLTLTADDGEFIGSDSLTVIVGLDPCDAAKRHPDGYTPYAGDVDGDCRVTLSDVTLMAAEWLESNSLTGTVALP